MGRVKKYAKQFSNRNKKVHAANQRLAAKEDNDQEMGQTSIDKSLPLAKRKQIFKKKNRRDVKKRIQELRLKSLKLKKKNIDQKAEKRKIAHEIKELTSQFNHDCADAGESDSDWVRALVSVIIIN